VLARVTTAMGSAARSCQVTGSSQLSGSTSRVMSVLRIHLEASPRYAARNSSHILARAAPPSVPRNCPNSMRFEGPWKTVRKNWLENGRS